MRPNFFKSVPVCYRAIKHPVFSQMASQVTASGAPFHPSFVPALTSKLFELMRNSYMADSIRNYIGCAPRFGSIFSFGLINKIAPGNYLIQSYLAKERTYDDLINVLSQTCGWNGITENQCVLRGCCYSRTYRSCSNPLKNLSQIQLQKAMQYMQYRIRSFFY